MKIFFVFVPLTFILKFFAPAHGTWIFFCAALAIIPLAAVLGEATEHLAEKTGEGLGGLLNATFGNAAELIIALMALHSGLFDIVKASLTGSIIGNILLVLGAALVAGGVRSPALSFNTEGARSQAVMLSIAAASLLLPACYHAIAGPDARISEERVSVAMSGVLLATYLLGLLFSLKTHRQLFSGAAEAADSCAPKSQGGWSTQKSLLLLLVSTAFIAWISEILVGSVEHAAQALGMTPVFVGVIVVATVGNAAEHSTAILMALRRRMDLSLGIAVGSSIQVALFLAPVLVFASYLIAPQPMDLVFTTAEVLAVGLSVYLVGQVVGDGKTNWLVGVQLLALYVLLGIVFYFLP